MFTPIFFSGIVFIVSGFSLFLFGMLKLTSKIQLVLNVGIRNFIKNLTRTRFFGVLLGVAATAIFQSSSATIVLIVGLVGAGLVGFFNSLGLILGANIGTTVTAQLVSFKITSISFLIIVVGLITFLAGKDKVKTVGEVIIYFGLLFFGLFLLAQGLDPFKGNQTFLAVLSSVKNPLLGIIVGMVFTALIQSSSATTSLIVILGQGGFLSLGEAIPLILGASIGTTSTALFASIGASKNAKRSALSHVLFNILSVLLILPFLSFFVSLANATSVDVGRQIANAHTLFKILMTIIFLPLLKPFAILVKKIIKGEEEVLLLWPEWLDNKYINQPSLALDAVEKELKREMALARKVFLETRAMIFGDGASEVRVKLRNVDYIELVIDNLQSAIAGYLDRISENRLTQAEVKRLFRYSLLVDEIERVGDHAENLGKLARWRTVRKTKFSDSALSELRIIFEKTQEMLECTKLLVESFDQNIFDKIVNLKVEVDELAAKSKQNHYIRFYKDIDSATAGPIFIDMIVNLQDIARHCVHVARYLSK